jgi:signal transduction histidine kinase
MAREADPGLRRSLTVIAAGIATLTALVIPAHYFFTAYNYEAARIDTEATRAAEALSEQIYLEPAFWQFNIKKMEQMLFALGQGQDTLQRRVLDLQSNPVVEVGKVPANPNLQRVSQLTDGVRTVGWVEVTESLRPGWRGTFFSGGLGIALGLAMFVALRILPMRALVLALDRLEISHQRLDAAQHELLRNERLAALGKLTATVSHELRNPLGTIRTSIHTIAEKIRARDLGLEPALERVERNIGRCDTIIGELLDYARVRQLTLQPIAIDPWLEALLDEQSLPAGVVLGRTLGSGATLPIDEERLRRVLINLLDNACDAVTENQDDDPEAWDRIVTVESRSLGNRLEITVGDTGPGVPGNVLPKVFEPLYSTKNFGVGLGLPTVKQIIEQHGGGVTITNKISGGAEVHLWLPLNSKPPRGE